MVTVQMRLEDDLANLLAEADRPLGEVARERLDLDLFRHADVSRGSAAELLGVDLGSFLLLASRAGIPVVDLTEDEWATEEASIDALVGCALSPARGIG